MDWKTEILLKKRLWHRCFPVSFVKFLGITFFVEHIRATAFGLSFVNPRSLKELV